MGGGPKPVITGAVEAALLGTNNKLTLAECRDRLAEATGAAPCALRRFISGL